MTFTLKKINLFLLIFTLYCGLLKSQMAGTYSVPGTFTSLAQAIYSLNTFGVNGPVTVDIAAGYTETAVTGGYSLYAIPGASSLNTIVFKKNGSGNNPEIFAYTGTQIPGQNTQDGVWRFIGADHISIENINITDLNTTSPATMEFGIGLFKAGPYDGCQYNKIKNCVITLNRSNNGAGSGLSLSGSRGIEMSNSLPSSMPTLVNPLAPIGANSYNTFEGNLIQNCHHGIALHSWLNWTYNFPDKNNVVGGPLAANGNTVINYGGFSITSPSVAGIYTRGQFNIDIRNNVITNNTGTVNPSAPMFGILNGGCDSSNVTITNNTISLKSGTYCPQMIAIENQGGSNIPNNNIILPSNNTITISNNFIANCNGTLSPSLHFYGIRNRANGSHLLLNNNTFTSVVVANSNDGFFSLLNNTAEVPGSVSISGNSMSFTQTPLSGWNGTCEVVSNKSLLARSTVTLSNNLLSNCSFTSSNCVPRFLILAGNSASLTVLSNTFTNINTNTGGSLTVIHNTSASEDLSLITNNSISNFSCTNSWEFKGYYGNSETAPQCAYTFSGNAISNVTVNVVSGFYGFFLNEGRGPVFPRKLIHNNTISNVVYSGIDGCFGIIVDKLGDGGGSSGSSVYSNTVTSLRSWSGAYAISISSVSSEGYIPSIYANTIYSVVSTYTNYPVYGIKIQANMGGVNVFGNKITQVIHNGWGTAAGIESSSGNNVNIYNNIIGGIITSTYSIHREAVSGILISGGYKHNISHNSIFLDGPLYWSSCITLKPAVNSPTLLLKNNLLVNMAATTGTGMACALQLPQSTFDNYSPQSDNNLYYSDPGTNHHLVIAGSSNFSTMAQVKTGCGGRDQNSVTEYPPFTSTVNTNSSFLSLITSSVTQAESGGLPLQISQDYYGNTRNVNHPDIGAVEDNLTSVTTDQLKPSVLDAGYITSACGIGGRTFTASIMDAGGVAGGTLSPRIYYSINNGSFASSPGTLSSGTSTLGTWTFSMNYSVTVNDLVACFIIAQDVATSPNLISWPSSSLSASSVHSIATIPSTNTFSIRTSLSGTYTVGSSGTFTTLGQAAQAYNSSCLTGPVTFVLSDIIYSASTESFPVIFTKNEDASSTNSLLIRPIASQSCTIQGPTTGSTTSLLKFLDARYIKVDGNKTNNSSLTLHHLNTTSVSCNVYLASSNNLEGGNRYLTFSNLLFSSASNDKNIGLMAFANSDTIPQNIYFTVPGGWDNDFISVTSNSFQALRQGLYAVGGFTNTTGANNNWAVSYNRFGPAASSTSLNLKFGLNLNYCMLSSVHHNTVMNLENYSGTTLAGSNGMVFGSGFHSSDISHNVIKQVKGTIYAFGVGFASGLLSGGSMKGSDILFRNNMISDITCYTVTGTQSRVLGLLLYYTDDIKIYHNTIALTLSTGIANPSNVYSSDIYNDDECHRLDLRNNLLYNDIQNPLNVWGSLSTGIETPLVSNPFSFMDHNYFWVLGSLNQMANNGNGINSVYQLQQSFRDNLHSARQQPAFTSSIDVHLDPNSTINMGMVNSGMSIPSITTDIDDQPRNPLTPVVGAHEFTLTAQCTTASGGTIFPFTYTTCSSQSLALVSYSVSLGLGSSYQWQIASGTSGPFTNITSGTGNNTPNYNSLAQLPGGIYYLRLSSGCANGSLTAVSNVVTVNIVAEPTVQVTSTHSLICEPNTATLIATGANSYTWNTGTISPSIVVTPTNANAYYVQYQSSPCAVNVSTQVIVYYTPGFSVSPLSASVCANSAVNFTATGATSYTWSNNTTNNVATFSPLSNSIYSVTGVNGICTQTKTVSVTVLQLPSLSISGNTVICAGVSSTLTATGASTYSWNTGSNFNSIAVSPVISTTYVVIGTNNLGCSSSTNFPLTVHQLPQITIQQQPTLICASSLFSLSASGAQTYSWSNGSNSSLISTSLSTGSFTYYVIGTDGINCSNSQNYTVIVNPLPQFTASAAQETICLGETAILTAIGAQNYNWEPGTLTGSIIAINPSTSTTYTVVSTQGGCTDTRNLYMVVNPCTGISVNNIPDLEVFPNPFREEFTIKAHEMIYPLRMKMFDNTGKLVKEMILHSQSETVNARALSNGLYLLHLSSYRQEKLIKIVKME